MQLKTEGLIVLGAVPNEEGFQCLICRAVPDRVIVDLFVPDEKDIPSSLSVPDSKALALPYRLCPRCFKTKPGGWKIRLLMLERLNVLARRGDL